MLFYNNFFSTAVVVVSIVKTAKQLKIASLLSSHSIMIFFFFFFHFSNVRWVNKKYAYYGRMKRYTMLFYYKGSQNVEMSRPLRIVTIAVLRFGILCRF